MFAHLKVFFWPLLRTQCAFSKKSLNVKFRGSFPPPRNTQKSRSQPWYIFIRKNHLLSPCAPLKDILKSKPIKDFNDRLSENIPLARLSENIWMADLGKNISIAELGKNIPVAGMSENISKVGLNEKPTSRSWRPCCRLLSRCSSSSTYIFTGICIMVIMELFV